MKVRVMRRNDESGSIESVEISSDELVPGDILDLELHESNTMRQLSGDSGISATNGDESAEKSVEVEDTNGKDQVANGEKKKWTMPFPFPKKKKKFALSGRKIACDAVLVSGNCIVNESILTGL